MQDKLLHPNLGVIYGFLVIFFLPLKSFVFKFSNLSISPSRFLIFLGVFIVIIRFLSKRVSLPRSFYNRSYIFLIFFAIFSFCYTLFKYGLNLTFIAQGYSFFESLVLLPLTFFLLVNPDKYNQVFGYVLRGWVLLIYFAFAQFILDFFGINFSFESIGEFAPENRAEFFGLSIYRVNSFFGEPRSLASMVILICIFRAIFFDRALNPWDWLLMFSIGILTVSSTFVLGIWILFASLFLTSSSWMQRLILLLVMIVLAFLLGRFYDSIIYAVPRLEIILGLFSLANIETISGDLAQQISDILFLPYILNLEFVSSATGLLGNGLGSSSAILEEYAFRVFEFSDAALSLKNSDAQLYGSRILLFTILLNLGFLGTFILGLFIYSSLKISSKSFISSKFRAYSYSLIMVSLLTSSTYFFIVLLIYNSCKRIGHNIQTNQNII